MSTAILLTLHERSWLYTVPVELIRGRGEHVCEVSVSADRLCPMDLAEEARAAGAAFLPADATLRARPWQPERLYRAALDAWRGALPGGQRLTLPASADAAALETMVCATERAFAALGLRAAHHLADGGA
ncbi:hypothetical protein J2T57_001237 [Natronocella acetinitrilica]|uniref:Uncharacterized protein n=1 Tax=Natronocella acetinitrilica TaxID=414046 RepID=A0AAE3KAD3_9GAMM|nr:hypothetical protein [Natronocella acetinitrilica]MCP1674135.1 hypothetical protein [Natronocella acetinitrilica]